jgi:hypothetical protein
MGLIEYRRRLCFWYEVTAPNDQYPWLMKQYKLTVQEILIRLIPKTIKHSNADHLASMSGRGHAWSLVLLASPRWRAL